MMLPILAIFVVFSLISCCFLSGIVCWDLVERRKVGILLADARVEMNAIALASNENSQALSLAIGELQERVQSHELRLSGGISKSAVIRQ